MSGTEEEAAAVSPAGSGWEAVRQTWTDRRRLEGVAVAAVPPLLFAVLSSTGVPLIGSLIAALASSVVGAVYRLLRRDGLKAAGIGLAITVLCAGVAAVTGQARGFFLLPAAVPFVVIGVCVVTMVGRRPLTGVILNRVSGGPADWFLRPRIFRVHLVATGAAVLINAVNATVQVIFYRSSDTVILAIAHIATGPVFCHPGSRDFGRRASSGGDIPMKPRSGTEVMGISIFTPLAGALDQLAAMMVENTDRVLVLQPGFRGNELHTSIDQAQLVNIARWSSPAAPQAIREDEVVRRVRGVQRALAESLEVRVVRAFSSVTPIEARPS